MRTWYVLVITAMLSTATVALAHFPEGVTHFAFQFPDDRIPMIDGDLSDWEIVPKAYRITTEMMYEQLAGLGLHWHSGFWLDLSDFAVTLMVGWNEATNKLYTAAQTYDNIHIVLRPQGDPSLMWRQDDFEVMIDADHSGGQYAGIESLVAEEAKRANGAQAQQYIFAFPQADGITGTNLSSAATWDVEPPYGLTGFSYDGEHLGPGTTTYEVALTPWDDLHWKGPDQSIIHDLNEGDIIGLQFSFGDFDDPEHPSEYHAYWTVSGQDETFKRADRFADFLLAPIEPWMAEPVEPDESGENMFTNIAFETGDLGVPHNWVSDIAMDDQGNAWIGTTGGLAKFDGVDWTVYNTGNSGLPHKVVQALAIDGRGNAWIGTTGGLAKFDGVDWTVYNTENSGLSHNVVQALAIDGRGNTWIGTGEFSGTGALVKFDGANWTVYPRDPVLALAVDAQGDLWMGTWGGGLMRFDGTHWTVYNTWNSGLQSNYVHVVTVDPRGDVWVGTKYGGLAKFDGTHWTVYNTENSGLPLNYVLALATDTQGNTWIGTDGGGLAKFDGTNWTVYNTDNSELPVNYVYALATDAQGNTWIGTPVGLTVYGERGRVLTNVEEKRHVEVPLAFSLSQNYPNPFNAGTTIRFSAPHAQQILLTIYDLLGQKVRTLWENMASVGTHTVSWDGRDELGQNVSSGVYLVQLMVDEGRWARTRKIVLMR